MFEYTALVDAPVQRFTGIVTGADPDDEDVMLAIRPPAPLDEMPGAEAPILIVAEPSAALAPALPAAPIAPAGVAPAATVAPEPTAPPPPRSIEPRIPVIRPVLPQPVQPRAGGAPAPAPSPSLVPALVAIAAAGITAMWWLRKDGHDRSR